MTTHFITRLLKHLSDKRFHSGTELGNALQVSRAAIWKAVKRLQELGIEFDIVKGRGYRLNELIEPLDEEVISSWLDSSSKRQLASLEIFDVIDSTNTYLLEKDQITLSSNEGVYALCLAEQQTAGRGRRGRSWQSPYGQNIYFSLMRQFELPAHMFSGLSLVVGVGLVRILRQIGCTECQLKWPNDVLVKGLKLAGILIEMHGDIQAFCRVVIGIGVNVKLSKEAGLRIDQPFTTLSSLGIKLERNKFIACLYSQLCLVIEQYLQGGLSSLLPEWQSYDALTDKFIQVNAGNAVRTGIYRGIDDQGRLLLECDGRIEALNSGEISLIRMGH